MSLRGRPFGAIVFAASLPICWGSFALADDCHPLTLVTSVDMVPTKNKLREFVPVTINGTPKLMLLDTGGGISEITDEAANELNLPRERLTIRTYDLAGEYSDFAADVSAFGLGTLMTTSVQLVVAPQKKLFGGDPQRIGIIGPDLLVNYDVSIDF